MRANEFLIELANSHYAISEPTINTYGLHYFFEAGSGDTYKVQVLWDGPVGTATVQFSKQQGSGWVDHVTGTAKADSLRVFSTVMHCVKDAIEREPEIETISFDATQSEPSRVSLYHRFAVDIARYLPGWRFVGKSEQGWAGGRTGVHYVVSRKPKTLIRADNS